MWGPRDPVVPDCRFAGDGRRPESCRACDGYAEGGGDYYFVTRSMGPLIGTVSGLLSWFSLSLKTVFAVFGLSEVVFLLSGERIPFLATAIPVTAFFIVLKIRGTDAAARLEVALVLGLLGLMTVYFLMGVPSMQASRFDPLIRSEHGFNAILSAAGFVFVSFGGLLNIATIYEEVRNPRKNIPGGGAATLVITVFIRYC